jgi:hypothetical protein
MDGYATIETPALLAAPADSTTKRGLTTCALVGGILIILTTLGILVVGILLVSGTLSGLVSHEDPNKTDTETTGSSEHIHHA